MRDSEVVASIVAGDPEGLAAAYDRYAGPLYQYCRTLLRDPADAADVVQDTFVIAASSLSALRDADTLRRWLYAMARNESLRVLRSGRETPALAQAPPVSDGTGDVRAAAERGELHALFEGATDGLSAGEREVIDLRLRQGLETAEVASVLGVSRGHAATLASRAHDQLEICLAVLLVARAGRADCDELGAMLADWDGHLTVLLRKRLHRHIENCAACSSRRAIELRPAMLLGLAPAAALAAGAAASFRLAAAVPADLRAHTIGLARGQGADAVAHRAAVLGRVGALGRGGFPKPVHGTAAAGPAVSHRGRAGMRAGLRSVLRSSSQGQTAVAAAVVLAVIISVVAFALTASGEGFTTSAGPKPPALARSQVPASASASASASAAATTAKPTLRPTSPSASVALAATAAPPAPSMTTPAAGAPATADPTPAGSTAATAASPSPSTPGSSPTPAKPGTSSTPAPSPSPQRTGILALIPRGGPLIVRPGGRQLLLRATGGTVDWSATITGNPGNAIAVSQSSGTLTASSAITTVTVTASGFVPCLSTSYPTITINPGGTQYIVCTGFIKPFPHHGHRHSRPHPRRHRHATPVAPATVPAPGLATPARPGDRE